MNWLQIFKRQNNATIGLAMLLCTTGLGLSIYSLSGTKYDVIEFCFRPQVINNSKIKYCTNDKRYIIPKGYWRQEKYVPANPRFQPEGTFLLSDKATRLRMIPATNADANKWTLVSLLLLGGGTYLVSKRLQRYKREFVAYFEQLKTDLNQEILTQEQDREITAHKITTETEYIKDTITTQDQIQRIQDKTPGELQFEAEQVEKNNELVELQRQLEIAKFKAEIAKLEAETAKYQQQVPSEPLELAEEIDYEALCPGKVGEVEFYDWRDLADDAVGIIIAGNSGSGKTSVATWIAGWLTKDEPAQVLALDPHANVNTLWGELGIHAISEFKLIEKQLMILLDLLDERRTFTKQQLDLEPSLIVFADEINSCLENFEDEDSMALAIKRLGSEARKYKIALIALNQSSNAGDLGISAQMRNNYLIVGLCATARQLAGQWKKDDPRRQLVEDTDYSCVVCGSVPEMVAVHPTHHTYKQFRKKGNKPKGLLPIQQLPLTIPLASPQDIQDSPDWHEEFTSWADNLGHFPNASEISQKWEELTGEAPSTKQVEMLQEYLLQS